MTEMMMDNVGEKLSKSREMCPGLSKEVYALTDYMSMVTNDSLVPQGMAILLTLCMEDIRRGESGFLKKETEEVFKYLTIHKEQVLVQAVYVLQIIDAIADEEFANEFRKICKEVLHFEVARREENPELGDEYSECVKAAVNWWANAIVSPRFDNGDNSGMPAYLAMMISSKKSINKEQLKIFKTELAEIIVAQMRCSWNGKFSLNVDYDPDIYLNTAARKAEIDTNMRFPWKTHMYISYDKVYLSTASSEEVIWERK